MQTPFFFLWLNDTSPSRYYWNHTAQNWTFRFDHATHFATREEAEAESMHAGYSTKAEVVVQEMGRIQ